MVRKGLLLLGAWLFSIHALALTSLTASVDKNPVMMGESLVLSVQADDNSSEQLDTSALLKDFMVGNTSMSRSMQIINGRSSRTTTWTTVLLPKAPGKVTIPSLTLQGMKTQPIALEVLASGHSQGQGQSNRDVYIQSSVDKQELYIFQPLVYTSKLYFAKEIQGGSLTPPELDGAEIEQVGEDKESQEIVNGKRYRVITREYLISPQKAGFFTIEPTLFDGMVVDSGRSSSFFSSFGRRVPIKSVGDRIDIEVKAIPQHFSGDWLPAELVTLHDELNPDKDFKVGEPITRTITLTAAGIDKNQLPEVHQDLPSSIKAYPDQADSHRALRNGKLVSQRVETLALVPKQAGKITLPEVKVNWFDTRSEKMRTAILPERSIQVAPGANMPVTPAVATPVVEQPEVAPVQTQTPVTKGWDYWHLGLLVLWLFTVMGWIISHQRKPQDSAPTIPAKQQGQEQHWKAAQKANQAKRGGALVHHLTLWCQSQWPQLSHAQLKDIAQGSTTDELSIALEKFNQSLYGRTQGQWQGDELMAALKRTKLKAPADKQDLPPLSPLALN